VLAASLLAVLLAAPPVEGEAPQPGVSPQAELEAKELARRSQREYDLEHPDEALRDIERAYLLDPRPGLLFNLGQCHRKLHHWEQAETAYRSYLHYRPDAPNREVVLELIEEMRQERLRAPPPVVIVPLPAPVPVPRVAPSPPRAKPPPRSPAPPVAKAPPPTAGPAVPPPIPPNVWAEDLPRPHRSHAAAWTFVGVGAAAAIVAVVGAVEVSQYESTASDVGNEQANRQNPVTPSYSSVASLESQALTWRAVGFVALGVAIASIPAVILAW